jgi:hypothetical protein
MEKFIFLTEEEVEPTSPGADPQIVVPVFTETEDMVTAGAFMSSGFMSIPGKLAGIPVKTVDTTAPGANPQNSFPVFIEGVDIIAAQTSRIDAAVFI